MSLEQRPRGAHAGSSPSLSQTPDPESGQALLHLPHPTVWPAVLAGGVALAFFGLLTTFIFTLAGVTVVAIAIAGWVAELWREGGHD